MDLTSIKELPRPLIFIEFGDRDETSSRCSISRVTATALCRYFIDTTQGCVILLTRGNVLQCGPHWRIRDASAHYYDRSLQERQEMLAQADLLLSFDKDTASTAPAEVRTICVYSEPGIDTGYLRNRVMVTLTRLSDEQKCLLRPAMTIIECPRADMLPALLSVTCTRLLRGPRYLSEHHIGADVQLQHFILDLQGRDTTYFGGYNDRHISMDLLFREISLRFVQPDVVETGCIRYPDDFRGAGFSTYLFGAYLSRMGGRLTSIDNNDEHCCFARTWTRCFESCVDVIHGDSAACLGQHSSPISVLYLDSMDASVQGADVHGLKEVQAAYQRLHDAAIVVYDDTPYCDGYFMGKGSLGIPWLLQRGWRVMYSGHQTLLSRY